MIINKSLAQIGLLTLLILMTGCGTTQAPNQQDDSTLLGSISPRYGNWCGADYPKDINNAAAPIDKLDAACQVHDICYQQQGYLDCGCDQAFNQQLTQGLTQGDFGKFEQLYVQSFRTYFKGSPCNGDSSAKFGPSRAINNGIKNISSKAIGFYQSMPFGAKNAEAKTDKKSE